MNTREIATQYRLARWAAEIQEKSADGETVKDFCRRKGISRNTYFYWQRKLREAVATKIAPETGLVPSGWTQLAEVKPETATENQLTVEVGGYRIIVSGQTDPELLLSVCRTLKSI